MLRQTVTKASIFYRNRNRNFGRSSVAIMYWAMFSNQVWIVHILKIWFQYSSSTNSTETLAIYIFMSIDWCSDRIKVKPIFLFNFVATFCIIIVEKKNWKSLQKGIIKLLYAHLLAFSYNDQRQNTEIGIHDTSSNRFPLPLASTPWSVTGMSFG